MNSSVLRWVTTCVLACVAAAPFAAIAGTFTVTPVRIYMTSRERAVAVTVVNEGDTDLVLQAEISQWSQGADGTDQLTPTEDLILAPPILRVGPKARQVVRLALLAPADASRQLTYRILLREVPEALPKPPDSGIRTPIALALSLPVFITPPTAKRNVSCSIVPGKEATQLGLSCTNAGSAYAQLREATLTRAGEPVARFEGGVYILPGATKAMALRREGTMTSGPAKLSLGFDDGQVSTDVTVP
jgi:fimbrial chaperone protein